MSDLNTVDYDKFVDESYQFKDSVYPILGLAGETGETVEGIKKLWRKYGAQWDVSLTDEERHHLIQELGDIAWYVTNLAHRLGYDLNEVLEENVIKITERQKNGKK